METNTKKTIGALGGIVVLLALLFIGISQSEAPGAKLISEGKKPSEEKYEQEASKLDYEKAILKDYENGTLIEIEGRVHKVFEEAQKGEATVLLDIKQESENAADSVETKQIILTFLKSPKDMEDYKAVHVYGRYIGTIEYETAVGTKKAVPALQVDYLSPQG
jgi:hypothetical protein